MIDVVIADNQLLTREGIGAVLSPLKDVHVLGYAPTVAVLDQMIRQSEPKVVIVDHDPDSDFSIDDIKNISARFHFTNVLVLSNNPNRGTIIELIEHGIKNHISKYCQKDDLVKAIYATAK